MVTIPANTRHPLAPLTPEEIEAAVAIVRTEHAASEHLRFVMVRLHEPPAEVAYSYQPGDPVPREAFFVLLDKTPGKGGAYEALVNLSEGRVTSWRRIGEGEGQPSITFEEFFASEDAIKKDPRFRAALAKRGITEADLERVRIDPWSAGNYGNPEEDSRRVLRTTVHYLLNTEDPEENTYAHQIAGLHAILDLNTMEVVRVDDFGVVPIPQRPGNYLPRDVGPLRTDLKPIQISQPEGTSFSVEDGYRVTWQKWDFMVGFSPREGLILYHIFYDGRPLFRSVRLAEMVVPYGDPSPDHAFQNAFDVGEYGVGWLANSLELGCDCLGEIHYFDAHMTENDGSVRTIKNAVCMHEEDEGILWKHWNYRTDHTEVRRSRRLVVSFIATVGIYEYGFFWYFRQDGSLEMDVKLTGIMNIGAVAPGVIPEYGELLNTDGLYAPIHQHFFSFRLEPMIDGLQNSVVETNIVAEQDRGKNRWGNAYKAVNTLLRSETEAQRDIVRDRTWKIINSNVRNAVNGSVVGYEICPGAGANSLLLAAPDSSIFRRAAFARHHLWVTPYRPDEQFPAGNYPNQHPGGAGLPAWTQANRSIENTILSIWYTVGVMHNARVEDWPVMPVKHAGFMLRPFNFFEGNPGLDVPPSDNHGDSCAHEGHA
jgi:primary-amine oxidase